MVLSIKKRFGCCSSEAPEAHLYHICDCLQIILAHDRCSEGSERESCKLKELPAEGDPDDRDAPENTAKEIPNSQYEAAENNPKHIQQKRTGTALIFYFLAERIQGQAGKLEALQSDRDADDRNTPENTRDQPAKST